MARQSTLQGTTIFSETVASTTMAHRTFFVANLIPNNFVYMHFYDWSSDSEVTDKNTNLAVRHRFFGEYFIK